MRFFKKCFFGFCPLKLRIGRRRDGAVQHYAGDVQQQALAGDVQQQALAGDVQAADAVKHLDPYVADKLPSPGESSDSGESLQHYSPGESLQHSDSVGRNSPSDSVARNNSLSAASVGRNNSLSAASVARNNSLSADSVARNNSLSAASVARNNSSAAPAGSGSLIPSAASGFQIPSAASVCPVPSPAGSIPSVGFCPPPSSGSDSFLLPVGLRWTGPTASVPSVGNVVPSPVSSSGSASPVSSTGSVSSIPSSDSVYASIPSPTVPNHPSPVASNPLAPVVPNLPPPPFIGPLPILGTFPRYAWQDGDYGSSITLAYYQVQPNMRPRQPEHMPDGVVGCVFNFPHKIVRTRARVVHVFGHLTVTSTTGHIIHVSDEDDEIQLGAGGLVTVGARGIVYAKNLEPLEVDSDCWVAVPIGGSIVFYDLEDELLDENMDFEVYWEET